MKILIGVNVLKAIDAGPYCSHMAFAFSTGKLLPNLEVMFYAPERCSIDRMRNESARIALDNNCDYLMFIDDDVIVEGRTLQSLIEADADIAMTETYIRGLPFNPMFFKLTKEGGLDFYKDFQEHIDEKGLVNVDAVGFSCVLIKCALLKKIPTPYFITSSFGLHQFTEDVYFSLKAIDTLGRENLKIVVDTKYPTGHKLSSDYVTRSNRKLLQIYYENETKAVVPKSPDRGTDYAKEVESIFKK